MTSLHAQSHQSVPVSRKTPHHSVAFTTRHRVRESIIMIIIATITFLSTFAAAVWLDFSATIRSRAISIISNQQHSDTKPIDPNAGKPINILLLGQDTRMGKNKAFGGGGDATDHQSDTAMIVQISADRTYVNIVSIPRDTMIDFPGCETSKGSIPPSSHVMFNSIFASGYAQGGDLASAASCSLKAVNTITGLAIDNFVIADFSGLSNMINAIGGVDLCIPEDTQDAYTGAYFKRGLHHVNGIQATQYARMRHDNASDGSDIMRTTRQQYLIKQLINQVLSKNVFTQSGEVYQLAKAALQALNMSTGLANPTTLVGLAMSLHSLTTSHIYAQTAPIIADPLDPNRVIFNENAEHVWQTLRDNKPLTKHKKSHQYADNTSTSTTNNSQPSHADQSSTAAPEKKHASANQSNKTNQPSLGPVDPQTGLATNSLGQLIDPNTGGIVNPHNGTIRNPETGSYIGFADKYINYTVCKIPTTRH